MCVLFFQKYSLASPFFRCNNTTTTTTHKYFFNSILFWCQFFLFCPMFFPEETVCHCLSAIFFCMLEALFLGSIFLCNSLFFNILISSLKNNLFNPLAATIFYEIMSICNLLPKMRCLVWNKLFFLELQQQKKKMIHTEIWWKKLTFIFLFLSWQTYCIVLFRN